MVPDWTTLKKLHQGQKEGGGERQQLALRDTKRERDREGGGNMSLGGGAIMSWKKLCRHANQVTMAISP